MAWIRELPTGRWQTCWRDLDGRARSKTFKRKTDARDHKTTVEEQMLTGSYAYDKAAARETLGRRYRAWLGEAERLGHPAPSTLAKYACVWKHVEPALGDRALGAIRSSEIRALVLSVSERVSAYQAVEVRKLVSLLLGAAVRDGVIPRNAASQVRAPSLPDRRPEIVEADVVEQLAQAVPERYRALVLVQAYSSLRWSEMVALRKDSIDWLGRTIFVDSKITESAGRFHEGAPKTARSRRAVAVPAFVIEALARHVELFGTGPDGLIFASSTGNPIRRGVFYRYAWWPAREALGLEGFKAKNLRHVGASIAGELSGDPALVRDRLGHSSLAMVSRVYQGVFDRRHRELADQMDAVARAAREQVSDSAADGLPMETGSGGAP